MQNPGDQSKDAQVTLSNLQCQDHTFRKRGKNFGVMRNQAGGVSRSKRKEIFTHHSCKQRSHVLEI